MVNDGIFSAINKVSKEEFRVIKKGKPRKIG